MRLNIQNKLFGGFGIAIVLLIVVSVIAYISLGSLAGASEEIQTAAELDDAVMSMKIALLEGMDVEAQALIFGHAVPIPVVVRVREYGSAASYEELTRGSARGGTQSPVRGVRQTGTPVSAPEDSDSGVRTGGAEDGEAKSEEDELFG